MLQYSLYERRVADYAGFYELKNRSIVLTAPVPIDLDLDELIPWPSPRFSFLLPWLIPLLRLTQHVLAGTR